MLFNKAHMTPRLLAIALIAISAICAEAQHVPATDLIVSRQPEITSLGKIFYQVNLDDGSWTRQQISSCPAFSQHAFALFTREEPGVANSKFLAIYKLNSVAAKSLDKPWQGGGLLFPLEEYRDSSKESRYDERDLLTVFNRIWTEEHRAGVLHQPPVGSVQMMMADCFIQISGEHRNKPLLATDYSKSGSEQVSTMLINLKGTDHFARTQSLQFGKDGLIEEAVVLVHRVQ
jgi:hypothetical protein